MNIEYTGELALPGKIGHLLVIISLAASLLSFISYFISARKKEDVSWNFLGRSSFLVHTFSIWSVIAILFVLIYNHRYEYYYVWQHSSNNLPLRYIFSCFWEGQEGSFMLWIFWHTVLSLFIMKKGGEWEAPVLSVVALIQVFISSMLLGVYIGDHRIGSNPFQLVREVQDNIGLPWTMKPDYLTLEFFKDGRGLNPLLQNYWMTIHPPVLFLGFASTAIPFAFACGALMRKKLTDWITPVMPWAVFSMVSLGTGILMGAAWAYEALTFGGFWAWDPVENASLVPWITLVGAVHTMLIYKSKGNSLFTALFLSMITFILVLYSTFLTRSGILGETSVHAFTDLGMAGQLIFYLAFFVWFSIVLLTFNNRLKIIYSVAAITIFSIQLFTGVRAWPLLLFVLFSAVLLIYSYSKYFPKDEKEEELSSREFWMFIGALVLLVSAFQITFYTSAPVINKFLRIGLVQKFFEFINSVFDSEMTRKLAGASLAPGENVVDFYNMWQLPIAVLLGILISIGQFLKYKKTEVRELVRKLMISLFMAFVITLITALALEMYRVPHFVMLFSSVFAIIANSDYFIRILKGKVKNAGASIAHAGFGFILAGVLISNGKQTVISKNTSRFDLGKEFPNNENILLSIGDTLPMGDYFITYKGKKKEGANLYYDVDYIRSGSSGPEKVFSLQPIVQVNERMGNVSEPSTKRFLTHDIYTHVTYVDPEDILSDKQKEEEGFDSLYKKPRTKTVKQGDTIITTNSMVIFNGIDREIRRDSMELLSTDLAVGARLELIDVNKKRYFIKPVFVLRGSITIPVESVVEELGLKISFTKVHPENGQIDLAIAEKRSNNRDFIIMKAIVFPYINFLWTGCILFMIGCIIAIRKRIESARS